MPSEEGDRYCISAKFLLRDRREKPYAVCGISTDITELKRAEEMQAAIIREREMLVQQAHVQTPPNRRVDLEEQDVELVNLGGSVWLDHSRPRSRVAALSAPGFSWSRIEPVLTKLTAQEQ